MLSFTLPDGNVKEFDKPSITGIEIAESIGPGLKKAALAIKIDGKITDLRIPLTQNAEIAIITDKSPEGLEIIRHDAAHLMAMAVKELFPETQVTIGPAIENGFYYDFARSKPFSTEDLQVIEKKMQELSKANIEVTRKVIPRDEAISYFKKQGEHYKAEIISEIPSAEDISLYTQGNFTDLCRGPHGLSTSQVKFFKLMKVSGAYWRGDSKNEQLTRIYGTAWATKEQLEDYLRLLEEAEKRDHRKIGQVMDLFHLQEEAQGMVFWHHNGFTIYKTLESYIRKKLTANGYQEVRTPQVVDRSLWEKSGHWSMFHQNMFTINADERTYAIKPMNCPCHVQIFNQDLRSYRELPLRMAEFGTCHRNESTGSLHGLFRVRSFTQDDAHIFCTEDQITEETIKFCKLVKSVYQDLGFTELQVKFSDRPETRAGTNYIWDKAEKALTDATKAAGLDYEINPGEGAFYGPKLEFHLKDAIGRTWQCGTLQVDFIMPERLDANYIGPDGNKYRPVMIHRAIIGTFERFIGILIENYAGKLPLWLAPTQVLVANITNDVDDYAQNILQELQDAGIRAEIDISANKISYKLREAMLKKVPILIVVGKNEKETKQVSIRKIDSDQQEIIAFSEFLAKIKLMAAMP